MNSRLVNLAVLLASMCSARSAHSQIHCIAQAEASLGGIALRMREDSVISRLGQPDSSRTYLTQDHGGSYRGTVLRFAHMEVVIGRGRLVERVWTNQDSAGTPSGIRIGLSTSALASLLGVSDSLREILMPGWAIPFCDQGPYTRPSESSWLYMVFEPLYGTFDRPEAERRRRHVGAMEVYISWR